MSSSVTHVASVSRSPSRWASMTSWRRTRRSAPSAPATTPANSSRCSAPNRQATTRRARRFAGRRTRVAEVQPTSTWASNAVATGERCDRESFLRRRGRDLPPTGGDASYRPRRTRFEPLLPARGSSEDLVDGACSTRNGHAATSCSSTRNRHL